MTRLALDLGTSLVMPFAPIAWPRNRVNRAKAHYHPPAYRKWRAAAAIWLSANWPHAPVSSPVLVELVLVAVRPKRGKLPAPRGDIDNYVKSVFDAFNGVVWEDDAQVVELRARKEYGPEAMISAFVQALPESNIT